MILADTSVWVDHLRTGNSILAGLLERVAILSHPWVIGELALGNLHRRGEILGLMSGLPQATVAEHTEVLMMVEQHLLYGAGIGYVDAQLLAATKLTSGAELWTKDKRLADVGDRLGISVQPSG